MLHTYGMPFGAGKHFFSTELASLWDAGKIADTEVILRDSNGNKYS
jgi:hypothetical protein